MERHSRWIAGVALANQSSGIPSTRLPFGRGARDSGRGIGNGELASGFPTIS
jgi:hypothetical protein